MIRRGILASRALTLSRPDDFFQYSYLYSVMITIYFFGGGEARHFLGRKRLPLKYPRKNTGWGESVRQGA